MRISSGATPAHRRDTVGLLVSLGSRIRQGKRLGARRGEGRSAELQPNGNSGIRGAVERELLATLEAGKAKAEDA